LQGEDRPGAAPVALLSHGFWERELGSDPGILGKTVRLDGKPHTVIGVVSRAMEFGDISSVELWVPIGKEIETADRGERIAFTQARLDPGATFSQAQEECDALAARLEQAYPEATGWGFRVSPMTEELLDDSDRSLLVVLFISVGLVLFIACANVANMIMARSASRAREIAVRLALGARRIAIVRQFLTEAMLLSLGGGLVGLLLARALLTVLVAITSGQNWIYRAAAIDYRVLLFTLVISMSAPLLFALLPSLKASRPDLTGGLKEGPRAGTGRVALRSRGFLVAAQLAMALSIMVVTGLLAREVIEIKTAGLGFEPEGVLTVTVELPEAKYDSPDEIRSFYRELEQGARARGAVEAALVSPVPLTSLGRRRNFRIEGKQPAEPEESPSAYFSTSGPGYFSAMSIPLLRGRDFGLGDSELSPAVALINETGARSYFAGDDPLGARIQLSGASASDSWIEIAGVVGDV
ncbi:MAG: ABC transporter permease, partial [Vicinamibacteria bacterium]